MANDLKLRREKTKLRIRGRISGTAARPRLTIYKSLKRIYVQVVDDSKGITAVVFDRNGYVYHGRVKALADSAREAGLQF